MVDLFWSHFIQEQHKQRGLTIPRKNKCWTRWKARFIYVGEPDFDAGIWIWPDFAIGIVNSFRILILNLVSTRRVPGNKGIEKVIIKVPNYFFENIYHKFKSFTVLFYLKYILNLHIVHIGLKYFLINTYKKIWNFKKIFRCIKKYLSFQYSILVPK